MTTKTSVPRAKAKRQQPTEPKYIPFEGDLSVDDRITALRTQYFYAIAHAESIAKEIERLGGESCKK